MSGVLRSRTVLAMAVLLTVSLGFLVTAAPPAAACENKIGNSTVAVDYHVDEPALAPHDACAGFLVGVPVVGTGVSGSVQATSPTFVYDYAQAGGYVCQVTYCVLAGASAGLNDAPFVGVCYIDVNQAICLP